MSYELHFLPTSKFLKVQLMGIFPRIDSEIIIKSIKESLNEYGYKRLLIDLRNMSTENSILADYQAAEIFYQEKFTQMEKIAIIDRDEFKLANDFFETTAFNRGLKFKFFYEEESEAVDWLNDKNAI